MAGSFGEIVQHSDERAVSPDLRASSGAKRILSACRHSRQWSEVFYDVSAKPWTPKCGAIESILKFGSDHINLLLVVRGGGLTATETDW